MPGGGKGRGWEDAIARFWKGLQLGKGMTVSVHSWTLGHVYCLVVVGEVHYASFKIKKNRNGTQDTKEKEGLGTDLFCKKFNRRRIRRSI